MLQDPHLVASMDVEPQIWTANCNIRCGFPTVRRVSALNPMLFKDQQYFLLKLPLNQIYKLFQKIIKQKTFPKLFLLGKITLGPKPDKNSTSVYKAYLGEQCKFLLTQKS